jgi:hypothetical protein
MGDVEQSKNDDEKLAWEDEVQSEDDVFFTPLESLTKEDISGSVVSNNKTHLEVNGVMHAYIVKQLIALNIVNPLGFLAPCGKYIYIFFP